MRHKPLQFFAIESILMNFNEGTGYKRGLSYMNPITCANHLIDWIVNYALDLGVSSMVLSMHLQFTVVQGIYT
jgi:hypothetical protein